MTQTNKRYEPPEAHGSNCIIVYHVVLTNGMDTYYRKCSFLSTYLLFPATIPALVQSHIKQ